ncbi:biotin-requiring enzyme, partial [Actinomyces oris]
MEDAVKRFVWPALKTLIAVVVAVALVKIAFFPSHSNGTSADISPGYAADVKTATVTTGSISNTVSVKGHIVQDATVEVQADLAGVVDSVAVEKDSQVSAGDPLLYIKHSESQPPTTKTDESGNVTQTPTEDKVTWSTIYAPVSGTVNPKVIKQQETGVGVVVATIT